SSTRDWSSDVCSSDLAGLVQVGFGDSGLSPPTFKANAVAVWESAGEPQIEAGYNKVVAFRLAQDGTLTLLRQLPARLLSEVPEEIGRASCREEGGGGG